MTDEWEAKFRFEIARAIAEKANFVTMPTEAIVEILARLDEERRVHACLVAGLRDISALAISHTNIVSAASDGLGPTRSANADGGAK